MSQVRRTRRLPTESAASINEALDTTTSVHKNALSWAVWRGHKEKKSVSFAAVTPAAKSQAAHSFSCSTASNLLRTRSVPDVLGTNPASSSSTATKNVSTPVDAVSASSMRFLTPQPFGKGGFSKFKHSMRMTNFQPDFCGQTLSAVKPNELRQTYSPSDRLAVKEPGRRKEQVVQSERDGNPEGSPNQASARTSFCSHIHFDIPSRSVYSVVFLVKSLCISLEELKPNPTLQTSTMSIRFGIPTVKKHKCTNHRRAFRESGSGGGLTFCRDLQSKWRSLKVKQTAPAHRANRVDSDPQSQSATPGLLSFRGPSPANIKATQQKGNADEGAQDTQSNFRHKPHTYNIGSVDGGSWDKQSDEKDEKLEDGCSTKPNKIQSPHTYKTCYYHSRLKDNSVDGAAKNLSLQEALELFRPDFINRSQCRVKRLEQRARRRRALHGSNPDLAHGLGEDRGKHKRNCTTPDPLSDNLFKPRERTISGREMQLRSRRIYNKLPEVTRRKEEEKRRAVSQTNRLRAEVYKKKLLDQVLQR